MDEQPLIAGIHGLATHEMYCPKRIATFAVGSYPAFSPLPLRGGYFLLHLLYPHGYQVISLRGALRCPDFPLPATAGSDRADLHRKGNKIRRYSRFGGGRDIRKMRFPPPYGP